MSSCHLFHTLFLYLAETATLETNQDILVATAWGNVVSYYHLCVLLSSHPQVHKVRVSLV